MTDAFDRLTQRCQNEIRIKIRNIENANTEDAENAEYFRLKAYTDALFDADLLTDFEYLELWSAINDKLWL